MALDDPTAEALRSIPSAMLWAIVAAVVLPLVGVVTPWEALLSLAQHQGVDDEMAFRLGFVAGFTLPLTLGSAVIVYLWLRGVFQQMPPPARFALAGLILIAAGMASRNAGLGLAPAAFPLVSGPPYVSWPMTALRAYVNTYGWPLALAAVVVGVATAVQLERSIHGGDAA
jgi:hypothetical protein